MKKNIMLMIGYLTNGGAEHSIINVANFLSKYHNVILVVTSKKDIDYECIVPIIEINELKTKKTKLKGILKLRKLKKEYHIDTTISYTTAYNFYNVLSHYKDKTIISVRNHLSTKKEGLRFSIIHKISILLCDLVVSCSKSVEIDQIRNYHLKKKKSVVIENFCDYEAIQKAIKEKPLIEKTDYSKEDFFVTMARMTKHKGHEHMIKAMSIVTKTCPNAKLLIFSRGELKEYLKSLAKNLNLENNIIFMDFHPNPYSFVHKAKGFILASDYEGFPNVIIEAMACGTPIIATDSPGGSKEILKENDCFDNNPITKMEKTNYGILIPNFAKDHGNNTITENEKLLSNAMITLLKDKKEYKKYQEKSLERVKKYLPEKILKKWLEIV